ncbi:uncharacterized protein LY89DRAFT_63258 [Mollisia scopiformis]|uniref:DUF7779 domain-containing protein n=1 Tax=Mollisia scopiformis TaxID=149040 RepID=A0A194X9C2_MOLSC|nr:uncharacterized protein LY89DRAFT_63258 [Mollisia scopiformis]KUJ16719.1 hypothetical protein LY89DRAFT_63258 [Mollisia scopiformis]
MVLISSGLGGITLKRALVGLYEQSYNPAYQMLQRAQSGVVFLGVPHPTYPRRDLWPKLTDMLRACTNLNKSRLEDAENDVATVANLSDKFEQAGITIKVLSVYETVRTKVRMNWYTPSRRIMLVGEVISETSVKNEHPLGVHSDHPGICKFSSDSELFNQLSALVLHAIENPPRPQLQASPTSGTSLNRRQGKSAWASTDSNPDTSDSARELSQSLPAAIHGSSDVSSYEIIPRVEEFLPQDRLPRLPCYLRNPQQPNPHFVGREDISQELDVVLLPPKHLGRRSELRSFALCGWGGLGKSQIAINYAFTREEFFDAIFWVQADDTTKLSKSFDDIAQALGLVGAADTGDRVVSRSLVLEWLSDPRKQQPESNSIELPSTFSTATWLLIFDNADRIELLQDYWPIGATNGSIVITSRDPLARRDLTSNIGIDLAPMTTQDCAKLLLKLTNLADTKESRSASIAIVEKLFCVPLAVREIAALIRRREMKLEEFLSTYENTSLLAEISKADQLPQRDQYHLTLASVWKFEKFKSPSALCLISLICLLDPDQISESILDQRLTPGNRFEYPASSCLYIDARTDLLSTSLITRNKDKNLITIHREVRAVIATYMSKETFLQSFQLAVQLLSQAFPMGGDRFNREQLQIEKADMVIPHVLSLKDRFSGLQSETQVEVKRKFVDLLQQSAWYLVQRAEYKAAKPLFEIALSICESNQSQMLDLLADTLFSYARYGEETSTAPELVRDYSARHLELCRILDDGSLNKHEDVGTAHTGLGKAYLLLDRNEEAVNEFQQCINIDSESPDIISGDALSQFALIYQAWAYIGLGPERYNDAVSNLDKVIEFRKLKFGVNDVQSPKVGYALHALGVVRKQKMWKQSFEAYENALSNFRATVGNNYFHTGHICLKLAEHHARASEFDPCIFCAGYQSLPKRSS